MSLCPMCSGTEEESKSLACIDSNTREQFGQALIKSDIIPIMEPGKLNTSVEWFLRVQAKSSENSLQQEQQQGDCTGQSNVSMSSML